MNIQIKDLLQVLKMVQNSLSKFDAVNLENGREYYWEIDAEELYDPYRMPETLTLGNLSDDWEELLRLRNKDEILITYDLKRLGNIFRSIQDNGDIAIS